MEDGEPGVVVGGPGSPGIGQVVELRARRQTPLDPRLDRWMELYCAVAEGNGGEPDAGSHLLAWAHAAGFTEIRTSASAWCYAQPDERAWWGGLWADRITATQLGDQAVERGLATRGELEDLAAAWRAWAAHDDAWFAVLHGELLATP